jgi:hypothetical protein
METVYTVNSGEPLLLGKAGVPVRALYVMEYHDQGWKINGCYLVPIEERKL